MTHIFTRTGDEGTTGIIGGTRLSKTHPRLHACGTVDELNALLGVTRAELLSKDIHQQLSSVQHLLFQLGTDLATPLDLTIERMDATHTETLEGWILCLEEELPPITYFILPSGSRPGALLHHARTICRRAERWTVALSEEEAVNTHVQTYLNRLSDYLFLAARNVNIEHQEPEIRVENN